MPKLTKAMRRARTFALLLALIGLAATPGAAASRNSHPSRSLHPNQRCKHPTVKRSYIVTGTLVSWDGTAVEITVHNANHAARYSGELTDQNPNRKGVQVRGGTYSVDRNNDAFQTFFSGYEPNEQPSAGDKVRIRGTVLYTKKHCGGPSYSDVNVKRVKLIDADGD
jgi:hypothetical protein